MAYDKATASIAFSEINIKTDGTRDGTKILLNGKEIDNLANLNFSFWSDAYGSPVSLSYRVTEKDAKPGTLVGSTCYYLIPPKVDSGTAVSNATASVGGSGFTLQASDVMPPGTFRGDERRKAFTQI